MTLSKMSHVKICFFKNIKDCGYGVSFEKDDDEYRVFHYWC
jgi:hypothetical protein